MLQLASRPAHKAAARLKATTSTPARKWARSIVAIAIKNENISSSAPSLARRGPRSGPARGAAFTGEFPAPLAPPRRRLVTPPHTKIGLRLVASTWRAVAGRSRPRGQPALWRASGRVQSAGSPKRVQPFFSQVDVSGHWRRPCGCVCVCVLACTKQVGQPQAQAQARAQPQPANFGPAESETPATEGPLRPAARMNLHTRARKLQLSRNKTI